MRGRLQNWQQKWRLRFALLASIPPRAEHGGGQKNYDRAIERIKEANGGELPSDL